MTDEQAQQVQTWFRTGRVNDDKVTHIDTAANKIGVSTGDMRQAHLIDDLARDFSREIESWIGRDKLQLAVDLNKTYLPQTCATHDFCDSNQAMINILDRRNIDSVENVELCTAIWNTAKRNNFYIPGAIAEP